MRKQNAPLVNDAQILTEIVDGKRGTRNTRLNNIKNRVNGAYTDFTVNSVYLGVMEPIELGKTQKKDMEHCYRSKTTGLSNLKSAILDGLSAVDKELCPYCGIREPGEFDHYLPKSKFQEFSVFSKNLIWSCHKCNHRKREHFVLSDRYLNTYYDVIPDEQFLFCRIGLPLENEGISFYLEKPDSIDERQYKDIGDHVQKLKLLGTYKQRASLTLSSWFKTWQKMLVRYGDVEQLKTHITYSLEAEIDTDQEEYGLNHYKVVLKKAVLSQIDAIIKSFSTT